MTRPELDAELYRHGDEYARGAAHDLAVNTLQDEPPAWLAAALSRGLRRLDRYPDARAAEAATAERHGRRPEEVVAVNGAAQGFSLLAALAPGRPVVVHPAFTEPERALVAAGHPPARVVLREPFGLRAGDVPEEADMVIVGNPNNPTGVLHPAEQLRALCRPGRVTVVDEAFMDFVPGEVGSLAGAAGGATADALPGLVVVRSLTKVLGLPGVRAGYLLADVQIAERLRALRPAWSLNALAVEVLVAAAEHREHAQGIAVRIRRERESLAAELARVPGVKVHPGSANFLLLEVPDGREVARRLRERHGIAVRPCHGFPGLDGRYLRVALRPDARLLPGALAGELGAAPEETPQTRRQIAPRREPEGEGQSSRV